MGIENEVGTIVERSLKQIGQEAIRKAQEALAADSNSLDEAIEKVGDTLERDALTQYKHAETWAIRGVVRDIIKQGNDKHEVRERLKEELGQELSRELTAEQLAKFPMEQVIDGLQETIETYLIGVVKVYQKESFDPLVTFRKSLKANQRKDGTIREYLNLASRFVGKWGRRNHYSDTEIMEFLYEEQGRLKANTYGAKVAALKTFITTIDKGHQFPIKVVSYKGQTYSPALSKDQVDALILAGCVFLKNDDLLRLAVMTIYGARIGEVAKLSYQHIDLPAKTITIPTLKESTVKPQPIPDFLMPVFAAAIKPCSSETIRAKLKKWARLSGFRLGTGVGVHAIRRRVVTELKEAGIEALDIYTFMRWSKRSFGMLPTYIKTPSEKTDFEVLQKHPFVETWKEALYLQKYSFSRIT